MKNRQLLVEVVVGANPASSNSVIRMDMTSPQQPIAAEDLRRLLSAIAQTHSLFALQPRPSEDSLPHEGPIDFEEAATIVAIILQRKLGYDVRGYGRNSDPKLKDHWWFETIDIPLGKDAIGLAVELLRFAHEQKPREKLEALAAKALDRLLAPIDFYNWFIWRGAQRLGIVCRSVAGGDFCYEIGLGSRSVRIAKAMFECESFINFHLGNNKAWTSSLLRRAGVSVPAQFSVRSYEEATEAADRLGYPVVVKPMAEGQQKGVILNIRTKAELKTACVENPHLGGAFLVERQVPGKWYRLLTLNGQLFKAFELARPFIIGTGQDSISELVERENASPIRGEGKRYAFQPIDFKALLKIRKTPFADKGYGAQSIPRKGERVELSYFGGGTHGGFVHDVTDQVHPTYKRVVERAHAVIRIPVCGYDLVSEDISVPANPNSYGIVEANSLPALQVFRLEGPEPAGPLKFLEVMTGGPAALRVPVILIVTEPSAPALANTVATAAAIHDTTVVCASREAYRVDGVEWAPGSHCNLSGAQRALSDREAEIIVLERFASELIHAGLGLSYVDYVIFSPDAGSDMEAFAERTCYLAGIAKTGCIFIDMPPSLIRKQNADQEPIFIQSSAAEPGAEEVGTIVRVIGDEVVSFRKSANSVVERRLSSLSTAEKGSPIELMLGAVIRDLLTHSAGH